MPAPAIPATDRQDASVPDLSGHEDFGESFYLSARRNDSFGRLPFSRGSQLAGRLTEGQVSVLISPMNEKKGGQLRLGVLLSGGGRTLMNILDAIADGRIAAEVAAVICSRECKGAERARARGLDVHVVPYEQMPDKETYSGKITELLDAAAVDLICMAGFLSFWRIPPHYDGRVINIHPALLPAFGGKGFYGEKVHAAALESGAKISGCTVHFVNNEAYDDGPIILQRCVPVAEGDTVDTLAARIFEQECIAYPEAIRLFAAGRLRIDGRVVHVKQE